MSLISINSYVFEIPARVVAPPIVVSADFTQWPHESGSLTTTTRTSEQTLIGNFWNDNIEDFWKEIAQTAALEHHPSYSSRRYC